MSVKADRIIHITQQLVGDIGRLPGVVLSQGAEQQLVQLITDAFEQVGGVALDSDYPPCRCGEYETCATCIAAHQRYRLQAHCG